MRIRRVLKNYNFHIEIINQLIEFASKNKLLISLYLTIFKDSDPFHLDPKFQNLILELINLPCSDFVETGTFLGASTSFVAQRARSLKIFTCEINKDLYRIAKNKLESYKNVNICHCSSEKYILRLLKQKKLGNLPLFFLDAHWGSYWPLLDELKLIIESRISAIILIDDFKVPGRPDFHFDRYSNKICGFETIKHLLISKNTYRILFPSYRKNNIFVNSNSLKKNWIYRLRLAGHLGYVVLFQNADDWFEKFIQISFVSANYHEFVLDC
ncbi:MAG: hypothetical protein ACFFC7_13415 [Candidatus Hermodarchaeota archaeon]